MLIISYEIIKCLVKNIMIILDCYMIFVRYVTAVFGKLTNCPGKTTYKSKNINIYTHVIIAN